MKMITGFRQNLFYTTSRNFEHKALELFRYQSIHNQIYKKYINLLGIRAGNIKRVEDIPFLPIEFFKRHRVVSGRDKIRKIFTSSGTTGMERSRHFVADISLYKESILHGFEKFYGKPEEYCMMGILPRRKSSSLVFMIEYLVKKSGHPLSGFYNARSPRIFDAMEKIENEKKLLIGISYSLLDLAERVQSPVQQSLFENTIIMETGGMKGKRKELTRTALHEILKNKFGISQIHSEYGMTELLSQAYSPGDEKFHCPPWMKIVVRDINDPLEILGTHQAGGINIIDLANIHSCAFIATGDLGKVYDDGSFEVLGRFDESDVRGCNLMAE